MHVSAFPPQPLYTALSDYRNAYRGEPQAPSREQAPYVEESGSGAASNAADGAGKTKRSNNFLKVNELSIRVRLRVGLLNEQHMSRASFFKSALPY